MLTQLIRGGYSGSEILFIIIVSILALTISFAFHEFMHAAVANWLGDHTARDMGRVTLNPLAHIDPIGTALILFIGFGWGKPVPVNPNNLTRFKSTKAMNIMVSLAGVTGNFILALISDILWTILNGTVNVESNAVFYSISELLGFIYAYSLGLLAFNLLPIPPLDGFSVVDQLIPVRLKYKRGYSLLMAYGPRVLMGIIMLGSITGVFFLSQIINLIEWPFEFIIALLTTPLRLLFGGV